MAASVKKDEDLKGTIVKMPIKWTLLIYAALWARRRLTRNCATCFGAWLVVEHSFASTVTLSV